MKKLIIIGCSIAAIVAVILLILFKNSTSINQIRIEDIKNEITYDINNKTEIKTLLNLLKENEDGNVEDTLNNNIIYRLYLKENPDSEESTKIIILYDNCDTFFVSNYDATKAHICKYENKEKVLSILSKYVLG